MMALALGVTPEEYSSNKMQLLSPVQQSIQARRVIALRNARAIRFKKIQDDTGYTISEIENNIRRINEKKIIRMTLLMYTKYEVYRYEENELDDFLNLIARRNVIKKQLLNEFDRIDRGEQDYSNIADMLEEFYQVIETIMPESLYGELSERLLENYTEIKDDYQKLRKVAIDMEAVRVLLSFSLSEYVAFRFYEKDISERRAFISDEERLRVLKKINDPVCYDSLDDKWAAYNLLKDYYGREILMAESEQDIKAFKAFCRKKKYIVLKPPYGTQGRGIRAVKVPFKFKLNKFFTTLLKENGPLLIEELIKPHKTVAVLNPDSVNTIRLITYFDGEKASIQNAFMKIGQKGSFVDNGETGGILVSIDLEKGILNSKGYDEKGWVYDEHPYTGITFKGYQLPDWDKAIALGYELADKVPGLKYIGWDIAYTSDNQWIVVEGNAKTQFFGQQCTAGKGCRREFLETVNYNVNRKEG